MGDIRSFESGNAANSFLKKTRSLRNLVEVQTSLIFLMHYRGREGIARIQHDLSCLADVDTCIFEPDFESDARNMSSTR